ncbi:hypothetical protein BUALT_Bualt01G0070500 [Buddleja alternifolia]|uniref:Low-temperature-induced 65 kDa protein n=1 Tax=Buddleja alternifolia TaxID=168488 RepID=A0AAV6YB40_9LAMI|nr:hypothetical protein BUALT_Bualt01G0070500 [Buddleja alternifolia]
MEGVSEVEHDHHHGNMKSVLKKVKDKAKKIKDTIKKHGHDEDDDDETVVNDHEVHGGPIVESTVIKSKTLPRETNVNTEKPTNTKEAQYGHNVRGEEVNRQCAPGQMAPETRSPRSANEVSSVVRQFDTLNVHDVPQPIPIKNQSNPESNPANNSENPESNPKGQNTVAGNKGGEKGTSVREYLGEKFRPGDEDKALSEVITNAFHKKKDSRQRVGKEHPVGKVTESEEVAAHLGTGKENKRERDDALASGAESSGQGVVDRLKDAIGSWLGKSTGMQMAQDSVSRSYASDVGPGPSAVGQGDKVKSQQRIES